MSCDIHAFVEVKLIGHLWHTYNHPRGGQNYDLFARMAGVRNRDGVTPIAEPRGLPDNVSSIAAFCARRMADDAHSHSWLSVEEMAVLAAWYEGTPEGRLAGHGFEALFGYLFGHSWRGWVQFPNERPHGVRNVRLVFWFDN